MYMDPEFERLDTVITGTSINTTAVRDHAPKVERQIQVVKERIRTIHGGLPYDRMYDEPDYYRTR